MSTFSKTAREVEMPNGDVVVLHNAVTENTTSNIKKFKYDDNGHVTESTAANATDLNLNSYSTPTTGSTAIGTSDAVQTAIGKLDHQSQIDQTNILYSLQNGAKNFADIGSTTFTAESGSSGLNRKLKIDCHSITGNIVISIGTIASTDTDASTCAYILYYTDGTTSGSNPKQFNRGNNITATYNIADKLLERIEIYPSDNFNHSSGDTLTITNFMVVPKVIWDTLGHDYQPPSIPNSDLTYLEAEDRAALAEEIDSGAKNIADMSKTSFTTSTDNGVTVTRQGDLFTMSGTCTGDTFFNIYYSGSTTALTVPVGNWVVSTYPRVQNIQLQGAINSHIEAYGELTSEMYMNIPNGSVGTWVRINVKSGVNYNNISFRLMICTKAAFGVSQKFVPYAKSNYQLTTDMGNVNAVLEAVL